MHWRFCGDGELILLGTLMQPGTRRLTAQRYRSHTAAVGTFAAGGPDHLFKVHTPVMFAQHLLPDIPDGFQFCDHVVAPTAGCRQ